MTRKDDKLNRLTRQKHPNHTSRVEKVIISGVPLLRKDMIQEVQKYKQEKGVVEVNIKE